MKSLKSLTVLLGLAVFLSAAQTCQSSTCLITKQEAQNILGEEVADPKAGVVRGMGAGKRCFYRTAAPMQKRGGVGTLTIVVYDPQTMRDEGIAFKEPEKFFEKILKVKKGGVNKIEEVPGLGDRAFWESSADMLHVLAHGSYVTVQVRDIVKMKAPTRTELSKKLSAHRRKLSEKAVRDYILPRIKPQK